MKSGDMISMFFAPGIEPEANSPAVRTSINTRRLLLLYSCLNSWPLSVLYVLDPEEKILKNISCGFKIVDFAINVAKFVRETMAFCDSGHKGQRILTP